LSALLLCGGRVRGDADFIFYNQPTSADGAVRDLGQRAHGQLTEAVIAADLVELPSTVDKVAFALSVDAPDTSLADLGPIEATVTDSYHGAVASVAIADMTSETSAIIFELYRRDGGWKVRAVGQGYDDGLAGLARDFGVSVDDDSVATMSTDVATGVQSIDSAVDWTNPPVPAGYEL
jgi:tellurite resistance protein TerA